MFFPKRPPISPYDFDQQQYPYHHQQYPLPPIYWQPPPQYDQQMPQQYNQAMPSAGGLPPRQAPFQQYGRPKSSISLANAFKNEEGQFDLEKTTNTIDQVLRVGGQITPIVKQVSSLFATK